ncbi:hypothetical protein GCM10028777_34770 [Angustibacter speluncae]
MIRVVIATEDQALGQELQGTVLEVEDTEVAFIATSTDELRAALLRLDADVAIVDELLGPEPVLSVVRDLSVRRPATAMLLASKAADAETLTNAMESGARGIVQLPATYAQLEARLLSAQAWSSQMRRILLQGAAGQGFDDDTGRGRLIGVAGSKGGVGTTTVVTHMALDVARTVASVSVCLVDLDLEKGDVPGHVEVRHRLGISDLAKVAEDLSPGTVADVMTQHESGVDILLAPPDIREVEAVTPAALRQIVAALRRQYDLVLVDLGSHATPAQATVLELVDEVILVVNPDVASMRGMRRTINAWDSLGVCKETDVRVLVNRSSKQVTVSMETVRQLTKASVLPVGLPAGFRRLEPALNARDPLTVRGAWWSELRKIGKEVGLVPGSTPTPRASDEKETAATDSPRRRAREEGAITIEWVAMLPVVLLVLTLLGYFAALGTTAVFQQHAAGAATRAESLGEDAQQAAEDALPSGYANTVRVRDTSAGLEVSLGIPGFTGDSGLLGLLPGRFATVRQVVEEPDGGRF